MRVHTFRIPGEFQTSWRKPAALPPFACFQARSPERNLSKRLYKLRGKTPTICIRAGNYACWQRFSVDVSALLFNAIIRDGVKLVNRLHNADLAIFQDYGPFALGFLLIALFIVVFSRVLEG